MPELPEVETTRRGIAPELTGLRATGVVIRNGRLRHPIPPDLEATLPCALYEPALVDGVVIDREGRSRVCPVRVLSPEANRLRREARLIEHLTRSGVLHGGRIGNTRLRWIRAQDHSRESRRLVEAGGHFFDVPKAAAAA